MPPSNPGPIVLKVSAVTAACLAVLAAVKFRTRPAALDGSDPTTDAAAPETAEWRIRLKTPMARTVAAGRVSLFEAAAWFGALNRPPPESAFPLARDRADIPLTAPVRTDDERLCLQVIDRVHRLPREGAPDCVDAVLRRLEAEYRAQQDKHGSVRLPDPSTLPIHDPTSTGN